MKYSLFKDDEEAAELFRDAKDLIARGNLTKALEIIEDLLLFYAGAEEGASLLHSEQATIFSKLSRSAAAAENPNLSLTYLLASVSCYSQDENLSRLCAEGLHCLAQRLGSALYYKECVRVGKQALHVSQRDSNAGQNELLRGLEEQRKRGLERMIKDAEFWIGECKTESIRNDERKFFVETERSHNEVDKGLSLFWIGLDVKMKREFMRVSIERLKGFVDNSEASSSSLEALEKVLAYVKEHKRWTTWVCRTICLADFSSDKECKAHLEQQHGDDFKPELEKDLVVRLGKKWGNKIQGGGWEPVDTPAAVGMIKTQLEDVIAFTSESRKKGWSNRWPLVTDEKRSGLLKEVKLLLVSLCERQILSCSVRDWVMRFPVEHLRRLDVLEESINDCHIVETPQSICFLECYELSQIRGFLKTIKCERHDGTDVVGRAVDSVLDRIRIKESIEFDEQFSMLLLDKRLLKSNNASFDGGDDDGKIKLIKDPDAHYAKAHAQGNDIVSWLGDSSSVDKSFRKPIREHNLEIWVAVLRAVQYTCKTLKAKYAKKENVLEYEAAVTFVEKLCMLEDERRKIVGDDQKISYASLLCDRCEERLSKEKNSLTARLFLCAVRDVFAGGWSATFDLEDCMSLIREGKGLRDEIVLQYTELLKSSVTEKVLQIDADILLIDNSRIRLLDNLTRLSAFDNRTYMLQLIKPFLLNEIVNMESKAKSDAAEADLLLEEEKMSQAKEKKKAKKTKITSASMASHVDKTVEVEHSVKLEPEEDKKPEGGQLETSSNTDIQVEATKVDCDDMENMSREDSPSKLLESSLEGAAARYNSALDMTLKNKIVNMESKAKSDAADTVDLLHKGEKKSQAKKKKRTKRTKKTSTSMASPVERKSSADLEPVGTSQSPKNIEEDTIEPKDTQGSEKGPLEISSNNDIQEEATKVNIGDMQNMLGEDLVSGNLESAPGGAAARYNSALDMTLKEIKTKGDYSPILSDLLVSLEEVNSMLSGAAEVLVTILESWHCWKISERESLVTHLFTLEENERMSCRNCRRMPNYPEQSSYGIVVAADSIRNVKCAFGDIKFVDILKVTRMKYKMLCDIKTGGCGTTNFVHHVISRCSPIFIIVLEWEKNETEKDMSETTEALEWEIDISTLYEGLEPKTNYRLTSMVGYSEKEEEHICIVYEKNRWVNLRRESLAGEVVGSWKSVVRFCGERKIRPEILFYEAVRSMMT